jgi:hypothetical protein
MVRRIVHDDTGEQGISLKESFLSPVALSLPWFVLERIRSYGAS